MGAKKGLVNGYPDGKFKPNDNITRAELTTVMQNLAVINGWDPNIIYEKFKAIKVGETTREELEKIFGRKLPDKIDTTLEYQSGVYELIDSENVTILVDIKPYRPYEHLTQVVESKDYYSSIKDETYSYPQTTKENYNKLEEKMSYESVSALLGGPGKLVSEFSNGALHFASYRWYSSTEDNLVYATFHNGELTYWRFNYSPIEEKTYSYPQTTKENYNKLETNMSYEFVSALLGGPGKLVSEFNSGTGRFETYCWYSTEDKPMNISFSDGRVLHWAKYD